MAKNYASIYASSNDSTALIQKFYLKEETTRGTLAIPAGTDYFYVLGGGSINFSQPINPSPHKSGRHNTSAIKEKKALEWSFPTFVNIDETALSAGVGEFDPALRVLWKSLLGRETISGSGVAYDSASEPSLTFSLMEIGDKWAKQAMGLFVDACEVSLPGDGQSQLNWSGMGVEAFLVGIGKSTVDNDGGQTVTLQVGEGKLFPVGSKVMLVEADGSTRSADTPAGSARTVVSVAGDVVTLDGAALADADGSSTPVYLCYFEPTSAVAIDNPLTGLVGSFVSSSIPGVPCIRSATINIQNGHELVNYCWGHDSASGSIFVPASRLEVDVSIEVNLNKDTAYLYNSITQFEAQDLLFKLGEAAGRHFEVNLPKVIFQVPSISVPENGSIPVTFEGKGYQQSLDQADEVVVSYK